MFPIDIIKTKLAVTDKSFYNGPIDCMKKVVKAEGIKGLYKGTFPTIMGVIPYAGIDLTIYSTLRDFYSKKNQEISILTLLSCGAFSSFIAQLFSYPFAIVRTKL